MSARDHLNAQEFGPMRLYRGEGTHSRPSYYPSYGPHAQAGAWWTNDSAKARDYARKTEEGKVYQLDINPGEAEPKGAPGNYLVMSPEVRERRRLFGE